MQQNPSEIERSDDLYGEMFSPVKKQRDHAHIQYDEQTVWKYYEQDLTVSSGQISCAAANKYPCRGNHVANEPSLDWAATMIPGTRDNIRAIFS